MLGFIRSKPAFSLGSRLTHSAYGLVRLAIRASRCFPDLHPNKNQHRASCCCLALSLAGLASCWFNQHQAWSSPTQAKPPVRLARLLFFSWLFGCWFSGRNSQNQKPKIHRLTPGLTPSGSLRSQQPTAVSSALARLGLKELKHQPSPGLAPSSPSQAPMGPLLNPRQRP